MQLPVRFTVSLDRFSTQVSIVSLENVIFLATFVSLCISDDTPGILEFLLADPM